MKRVISIGSVVWPLGALTLAAFLSGCRGYVAVSREDAPPPRIRRDAPADVDDADEPSWRRDLRRKLTAEDEAARLADPLQRLSTAEFERGPQLVPYLDASFMSRVSALKTEDWPSSWRRWDQGLGRRYPPPRGPVFEDFNNITVASRAVDFGGRRYFFFSAVLPGVKIDGGTDLSHTLVYIPEIGDSTQVVLLPDVKTAPGPKRLEFDVVARDDAIVLVYAAVDGLYQMFGRAQTESLVFSPPERIHPAAGGASRLQLARSGSVLHLLWIGSETPARTAGGSAALLYMRQVEPSARWEDAIPISTTPGSSATLLVENEDVYVCWSDHRFRSKTWDTYKNAAKAFIRKSRDGGRSFLAPVLLSKRSDENETHHEVLLFPSAQSLLILWQQPRTDKGNVVQAYDQKWQVSSLDRDLKVLRVGGSIPTGFLRGQYGLRMRTILADPARAVHKFPAGNDVTRIYN